MLIRGKNLGRLNNTNFKSKRRFSIRKLSVGTVSIMVGISFMFTGGSTVNSSTEYSDSNLSDIIRNNDGHQNDMDIKINSNIDNDNHLLSIRKKAKSHVIETRKVKKNSYVGSRVSNTGGSLGSERQPQVYAEKGINFENQYSDFQRVKNIVNKRKKSHKKTNKKQHKKKILSFNIDRSFDAFIPKIVAQDIYYLIPTTDGQYLSYIIEPAKKSLLYSTQTRDKNITETGKLKSSNHIEDNLDKYQSKYSVIENSKAIFISNYVYEIPYVCYRLNFDQNIYNFSAANLSINFKDHSMPKKAITQVDYAHSIHPIRKVPNNLVIIQNRAHQTAEYISQATKVVYYDEDSNKVIKVENLTNKLEQGEKYNTQAEIIRLFQKHYILVSDPTLGRNISITKQAKIYEVRFRHQTATVDSQHPYGLLTKTSTTRRIHYLDENNKRVAPSINQTVTFFGMGLLDLVTGKLVNLNSDGRIKDQNGSLIWHTNVLNGKVPKVISPSFDNKKVVEILPKTAALGRNVNSTILRMSDNDQTIVVKYR